MVEEWVDLEVKASDGGPVEPESYDWPVEPESYDWPRLLDELNRWLRLRTTPIGMKLFETVEEMEAIPRIRRPKSIHTTDQIVAQACRLGFTMGITVDDLVGAQCGAVIGLHPQDGEWLSGERMAGVWYATQEDAAAHQGAMDVVPFGRYRAMAVSPLASGRLNPPDICLIYATPAQMILLINGLQWSGYKKLEWGCVGESACADSWGRALATGEPSLSIPCYAERRYGASWKMNCSWLCRRDICPKSLQGWRSCRPMGCATRSRSTGCKAMRAPDLA